MTVGAFDGVHAGHQSLVAHLRGVAADRGLESVVVTFDRHPASVVRPESAPALLCDLEQKLSLLAGTGVDAVVVIPFDEARASEEAEHFVSDVLVSRLGARVVAVGSDFRFGHRRRGNVGLLEKLGAEHGFDVVRIEAEADEAIGAPVRSTAIRRLVAEGEMERAAAALGRLYEVRGTIRHGDGRGRELGYPTANVEVPAGILLPAIGIYAGRCVLVPPLDGAGGAHAAAISLGVRPTFHHEAEAPLTLEAFLIDVDTTEGLYGREARVTFASRLRDEVRFSSAGALREQIARDVTETRSALARAPR